MAKPMSPSEPITPGQIAKFYAVLEAALRKSGLPSAETQQVLETHGAVIAEEFVALVRKRVEAVASVEEQMVDYDSFRTIDRDAYAYVGDVTIADYPETETGTKPVRFRELEFDHNPTDDEVLAKAKQENCRQPSRAEAETRIRRYAPEQLREHPRVGLIGPAVRRHDDLGRACVDGSGDGVRLAWRWTQGPWGRYCRFVVVQN